MLFLTLDVDVVEAPSIGDRCFTNQARGPFSSGWSPPPQGLRITSLVQTERKKKTDVGFRTEWPYRVTCRAFPF